MSSALQEWCRGDGDQIFLGHHVAMGMSERVSKRRSRFVWDADEALAAGDGDAGDLVAAHDFKGGADGLVGLDGDGVDDHAALGALEPCRFRRLVVNGEIGVDDADAALLSHGDGHAGLVTRIHGAEMSGE